MPTSDSLVFDRVTKAEAMEAVIQLATLKNFPSPPTYPHIADKLADWCRGTAKVSPLEQLKWLVKTATESDDYPGPRALFKLLDDKFYPTGVAAVYQPPKADLQRKECSLCLGWWTVKDEGTGKYVWCTCASAIETRRQIPNWLETVNMQPSTRVLTYKAMMSQKSFLKRIR